MIFDIHFLTETSRSNKELPCASLLVSYRRVRISVFIGGLLALLGPQKGPVNSQPMTPLQFRGALLDLGPFLKVIWGFQKLHLEAELFSFGGEPRELGSQEPVPGKAIPLELNLASLSSVRAFAPQGSRCSRIG